MLSELTDTAVRVSCLNVVAITKSKTAYIKAPEEFLKQVRLLQAVDLYILWIIDILQKSTVVRSEVRSIFLTSWQNVWVVIKRLLCRDYKVYLLSGVARAEALCWNDNNSLADHFKYTKTLALIRCKYWWPRMTKQVHEYVMTCTTCCWVKAPRYKPHGLLSSLLSLVDSFTDLMINFIIKLSSCKYKEQVYNLILVIVDCYI